MKKSMQYLRIVLIVIIVLEAIILAGCNTVNNTADINSSYDAIKAACVNNSSNSEISFIYDAINNRISGYPKTVPDFINLPVDSIIDAIDTDERIHIEYANDDNYQNGIIIAQEPKAGAAWDDDVIVNLTVNRKYSSINSKNGSIGLSLDKLYLLPIYYDNKYKPYKTIGAIWADGEKLIEGELSRLYVDKGNVYYNEGREIKRLNGESILKLPGDKPLYCAVINEKIYYLNQDKNDKLYCYNINDKTNTLIYDEPVIIIVNSDDYIIYRNAHNIFILDNTSYTIIKHIHCEELITDFSLDNDNLYFVKSIINDKGEDKFELTKYDIKQDTQKTVFESNELTSNILAIDDKIVFLQAVENKIGIRYIDMKNMENNFFTVENDDRLDSSGNVIDILFDGQRIIYEKQDQTFYSICIFTGETKKLELNS